MTIRRRTFLQLATGAAALQALPDMAFAQAAYPSRPARIIVGFTAGGATDIQARLFAAKMTQLLRQQFIVDNRSGAGAAAVVPFTTVANASPDGYTLLAVTPSFTFSPVLHKNYPVDPIRDFAPVSLLTRAPYLLVVNEGVPAKSVAELIALAQAQPGKFNFGAGNIGSGTHLVTLWFLSAANIKAAYIPYKSTGIAMQDLVGGRLDATLANILSSGPFVRSGRLRALGISSDQRSAAMPELPTLVEQGVRGYTASTFHGYIAPAKTPAAVINKLSAEFARAANAPDLRERLAEGGGQIIGSTPAQFGQFIAGEVLNWRKLVQDTGLKIEE